MKGGTSTSIAAHPASSSSSLAGMENTSSRKRLVRPFEYEEIDDIEQSKKTRTFTFELLSNIEMREAQANDDVIISHVLSQIKQKIIEYIREKSPLDDGGIRQYLALGNYDNFNVLLDNLSSIITHVQLPEIFLNKINNIIAKHKELVRLQGNIVLKTPLNSAQKRWEMLKTYVQSGLARLNNGVSFESQSSEMPLFPVAVPEPRQLLNLYPMMDTINRLAHPYREAGRWIFNHLKILTFKELCASIKESVLSLHPVFNNLAGYHVVTCPGRSQEWMANIATRYLPKNKAPESFLPHSLDFFMSSSVGTAKYNNYVIFDDVSYTGTQIIERVINPISGFQANSNDSEKAKLFIVLGFVSIKAKSLIEARIEKLKNVIFINLICNRVFNDIGNDLIAEKIDVGLARKIKELSSENKTTVLTEWKTPDFVSTPIFLTRGSIIGRLIPCFRFEDTSLSQYYRHTDPFDKRPDEQMWDDRDGVNPTNQVQQPYYRKRI